MEEDGHRATRASNPASRWFAQRQSGLTGPLRIRNRGISLTPRFSGVITRSPEPKTVLTVLQSVQRLSRDGRMAKTVKTVFTSRPPANTPLKRGVNKPE